MLYSRWRPDQGGYDVFEAPGERRGLGDDMPIPRLPSSTELGVPSVECGRQPTETLRPVGVSPVARGSIMPLSRAGLAGVGFNVSLDGIVLVIIGAVAGWYANRKFGKR